jgi:hypothetical protein
LNAGEPWKRHAIDDSSRGADGVRLADVNGDGLPDIATGWEEGGVIRVYVNPGPAKAKQAWPAVTVGQARAPEDAVLVDLDGDGALDVVSSCEGGTRTVFAHWAPSRPGEFLDAAAWKTEAFPAVEKAAMWMFALPMQVDGRAGIDVVIGSKGDGASIGWLESPAENPRDLAAWKFHPLRKAGWIMSLQAQDMDGDGDQDILASDRKGGLRGVLWLENPGAKAVAAGAEWKEHRLGGDNQMMFLTRADFDQDGRLDVVCAVSGGNPIAVFRATGDPKQPYSTHEIPLPADCGTGKGVGVGDIDGDGVNDVVFSCENAGDEKSGIRWLKRKGERGSDPFASPWQDHEISGPQGVKYDRLELLDLDGDGDLDVLCCEERDQLGVVWYENPTPHPR